MGWLESVWQNASPPPIAAADALPASSVGCAGYELQHGLDYSGADIFNGNIPAADEVACCAAC